MIIFILLLGVIVFHVLNYTKLNKCSLVEKAFKWISSKLLEKKHKGYLPNDVPEEIDGYRLERSAAGDQELPTITYSVIEISQPAQNQEENCTDWKHLSKNMNNCTVLTNKFVHACTPVLTASMDICTIIVARNNWN